MRKVSIIMSCFNEKEEWIRSSIESIINQTYRNLEIIIILDNPKNFSIEKIIMEYVNKDCRIKFIKNTNNLGLIKSLNKGLELASGNYIARMDADDISKLDRIDKQVKYLNKNKKVDFLATGIEKIDENDNIIKKEFSPKIRTEIFQFIGYFFPHPTWMFKRKILNKLKRYNDIDCAEDLDFSTRALLNGFKLEVLNECLLEYRVRDNGISKSNELKQKITAITIRSEYLKSRLMRTEYDPQKKLRRIINDKFEYEVHKYNKSKYILHKNNKSFYGIFLASLNSKYFIKVNINRIMNSIFYQVIKIFMG